MQHAYPLNGLEWLSRFLLLHFIRFLMHLSSVFINSIVNNKRVLLKTSPQADYLHVFDFQMRKHLYVAPTHVSPYKSVTLFQMRQHLLVVSLVVSGEWVSQWMIISNLPSISAIVGMSAMSALSALSVLLTYLLNYLLT